MRVPIYKAKANLSKLIRDANAGETIIIVNGKQPVAQIVPIKAPRERELGTDVGRMHITDDFDAPLPASIQKFFES